MTSNAGSPESRSSLPDRSERFKGRFPPHVQVWMERRSAAFQKVTNRKGQPLVRGEKKE